MNCKLSMDEDTLTAELEGEIDHHCAKGIREQIDLEIDTLSPKTLILDFSQITFMDSSGIGLIMGRYKKIHSNGGKIKIKNPSPNTYRVLKLAGMDRLAKIEREEF